MNTSMTELNALENKIWAERHRPTKIVDCILPKRVKEQLQSMIESNKVGHLLFASSTPGTGKTTAARAIINELDGEMMFINASLENGIDTIRTKVMQFSSTMSLEGKPKFILFDEFDGVTPTAQASLRGIIEEFTNVRFFFTCNYRNKVIDAILSRTTEINVVPSAEERPKLQSLFFKRVCQILTSEKIEFDAKVVASLITKHYPDNRKILNELQRYSVGGSIDAGILVDHSRGGIDDLINILKAKNFTEMRKWVAKNSDVEAQILFRRLYDIASDSMEPGCIPQLVMLLADYGFKSVHSIDQEILIAAALTEVMANVTWK